MSPCCVWHRRCPRLSGWAAARPLVVRAAWQEKDSQFKNLKEQFNWAVVLRNLLDRMQSLTSHPKSHFTAADSLNMIPDHQLDTLLRTLWQEGQTFDAAEPDPSRKRRNITPSTGRFLELLIQEERPRRILELGTSNGYSTLWLLRAATVLGIPVDSVDQSPDKHAQARANLAAAEVLDQVQLHTTDAYEFLRNSPSGCWDFIFLDSSRSSYISWWPELQRCFAPGVLVVDNAVSHATELLPLQTLIDQQSHLERSVLTIGNGQLLVRRRPVAAAGEALVQLGVG